MNEVVFHGQAILTVTKKQFTAKGTGEVINYNAYEIEVDGETFKIKMEPSDKKLFEYIHIN